MKNILLTGGAGYIGSHVAHLLLDQGHSVTIIDSLITGHKNLVPKNAKLIICDIIFFVKKNIFLIIILLIFIIGLTVHITTRYTQEAKTYEDCILKNLKGINNFSVIEEIKDACGQKFNVSKNDESLDKEKLKKDLDIFLDLFKYFKNKVEKIFKNENEYSI